MKKSVKFYTFGCKTNQYETQAIREGLISSGSFVEGASQDMADIYIVNTCTVTEKADRESRRAIRHCHRENPNAEIVVTGCLAEMDEDMIKELPGVSYIVRNSQKDRIKDILKNNLEPFATTKRSYEEANGSKIYTPLKISDFHDRTRAFVKIQDGCDNLCSYCKVPLVRGRSRSRELEEILEEVRRLLAKGFKELVLTGICLGDWGKNLKRNLKLTDLLEEIEKIDGDFRVRLSSIEPNMVADNLIMRIKECKKICRHLHLPLQSGSDRILKLMNRSYTAKGYSRLTKRIRKIIPEISITSDVMVGFPGETERDFKETIRIIRDIKPTRLHIFTYSRRKGVKASGLKSRLKPDELKRKREILEDLTKDLSYRYRKGFCNKVIEGLVETRREPISDLLTGYTDTYIKFLLDGPDTLMGRLVPLKIYKVDVKTTFCKHL